MNRFEDALVDLLLKHNCVIVPGFGGFVTQEVGAKLDKIRNTIEPPKKSLLFNAKLTNNDGLLVNYICQDRQIDFEQSQIIVSEHVVDWKSTLNEGGRIELDKIGILYLDEEKNIQFDQDRFANLLLASYGLETIHFIGEEELNIVKSRTENEEVFEELKTELTFDSTSIEQIEKDEKDLSPIVPIKKSSKPMLLKLAAAAVLVPILFYSYWIPMRTNVLSSGIISLSDFDPSYEFTNGQYDLEVMSTKRQEVAPIQTIDERIKGLPSQVEVYYYPYDDGMYIPVALNEDRAEESEEIPVDNSAPEPPTVAIEPKKESILGKLVVGSFSKKANAVELADELQSKGFKSEYMALSNGMWRVSAGKVQNEQERLDLTSQVKAIGLEAWLLK